MKETSVVPLETDEDIEQFILAKFDKDYTPEDVEYSLRKRGVHKDDAADAVDKILDAIARARELFERGSTVEEVESKLIKRGITAKTAADIAFHIQQQHAIENQEMLESAKKNMLYGGLWFFGGSSITAITFLLAGLGGGSKFFLAWGAIIFGGIQFFNGWRQYSKCSRIQTED